MKGRGTEVWGWGWRRGEEGEGVEGVCDGMVKGEGRVGGEGQ